MSFIPCHVRKTIPVVLYIKCHRMERECGRTGGCERPIHGTLVPADIPAITGVAMRSIYNVTGTVDDLEIVSPDGHGEW